MKDHLVNAKDYISMCQAECEKALHKASAIESIIVLDIIRGLASVQADLSEFLNAIHTKVSV